MSSSTPTRRRFLQATAAATSVGLLAGCTGDDGGGGDGDGSSIENYLSDATGYGGSLEDATGQSEVTVEVGAGSAGLAFDPAGVTVDAGTTVVWEWTGQGGEHNVNSVEGSDFSFRSGDPVSGDSETFEQTFDEAGAALYECTPHSTGGMLGAVEVQE